MAIDFSKQFSKIINVYKDNIIDGTAKATMKVARKGAKKLRNESSPVRTGKYAKSWSSKTEKKGISSSSVIYNKKHYQLTHLLERGHANRDGSRTPARVHIKPVEEEMISEYEEEVIKVIENG